jgi:hypothetical protein
MVTVSVPGLNLQVGAPIKDDLLAGTEKFAQGASKVTEINLNPSTMSMIAPSGFGGDATKKMKLLVVHDYSYDKPGMYRMEDVDGYVRKLQDGSWSCPVVSREKDKLSYICAKADPDQTNEMVILDATPQKLTFIHMAGALSLSDLTNMSDRANVLSRQVSPRGNQFTPQIFLQQQQHLQEQQEQLQRRPVIVNGKGMVVPTPPMSTTPAVPVAPATPAQ